jgi:hypothetical protein
MSITIEQLASRLTAEAERRGVTIETLVDELAALLDDPLEAFIGCAASGRTEPFDIHRERVDAAGKKIAQGI